MAVKDCVLLEDGTFDLDMGLLVWMKPQYYGKKYECVARSMLVVTGEDVILLDTGCGEVPERTVKEYNFKRRATLLQALGRAGYPADEVTIVINTHLHFDHCGWNRAFKKARFIVQEAELDYSQHPHKFQRDGYSQQVIEGTKFEPVTGDHEVTEGVRTLFTPGHTPGHQSVDVLWGKRHYVFCGDTGAVAENVLKRNVIGITTDPVKCLESIDRIRAIPDAFYVYAHDNQQAPLPKA